MIKGVANDLINFNVCLWKHFMNIFFIFGTNGEWMECVQGYLILFEEFHFKKY